VYDLNELLGPTERFTGESRRPHTRTSLASSSSKRRKISGSDEDSNSLDNCVRWDTSSQTVTYENPLAKTGQEEILALIRNAETSEFQEENDHAEVPCVDEPSDKNVQDDMINPSSPSLVAPIVTKGDSSANRSGQVMYEDRDQILGMRTRPPQKKFMFSSIPTELRVSLGALVSELGGHDVDAQYFNPSCTHVIVGKASRNEKYLSSVAAGKWVLHMSYLEACREAGKFVDEEPHEWGTMVSGKQPTALEEAARKWRLALTEKRKTLGPKAGAFNGWKILLAVDGNRLSGMKRLLEAGSAEVLGVRTPFPQYSEATHAFVDLSKLSKLTVDKGTVRKWIEVGVNCYKPDFIAEYLMHEDKVDEKLHVISQQELS
jgi:topoisomerase (DNA) II binding protein 1